jgi:hypothetical protein
VAKGAFEAVMFDLVEAIHVELPYKTVHFVVSEETWQNDLLEFDHVLNHELQSIRGPINYLLVLFNLYHITRTPRISNVLNTNPATYDYSDTLDWFNWQPPLLV